MCFWAVLLWQSIITLHGGVLYVCPEGDVPPPAAPPPPRIRLRAARPGRPRGPAAAGARAEGAIETDAVPDPARIPATAPTLGRGSAEDEEAAPGDATRERAPAPQTGTGIEEGTTHHAEEPGERNCMINDKVVLST